MYINLEFKTTHKLKFEKIRLSWLFNKDFWEFPKIILIKKKILPKILKPISSTLPPIWRENRLKYRNGDKIEKIN